jgi:Carboxypeptidase regulatory-like domain
MSRSRLAAVAIMLLLTLVSTVTPASAQPPEGGRILGHVTKSTGEPAGGGSVWLVDATTELFRTSAPIDEAGAYSLSGVAAGSYKLRFFTATFRQQWAHQQASFAEADVFTVADGEDTVVDEVLLPTGSIAVTASDQLTGAPLARFCADISGSTVVRHDCTETGTVTLTDLPPFNDYFLITTGLDNVHLTNYRSHVAVVAEQTTAVHVELEPGGLITTTILDAATHTPVADACVYAVTDLVNSVSRECSGPDGRVTSGPLPAGPYLLYVWARDGVHGDQWVGPLGGTGSRFLAKRVDAPAGQTVTGPTVLLDGAGSISGSVVDQATGAPVEGICVRGFHGGAGDCTGPDGRYTINGLGPYLWPVQFIDEIGPHAWQWSGDRPTQLTAKPVRVRVGQTTTEDAHLRVTATVSGRVTDSHGRPVFGFVQAYNAITGDLVTHEAFPDEHGDFRLEGIAGPQFIRVRYSDGRIDVPVVWHRDASSFATADPVGVRSGAAVTGIDITMPGN